MNVKPLLTGYKYQDGFSAPIQNELGLKRGDLVRVKIKKLLNHSRIAATNKSLHSGRKNGVLRWPIIEDEIGKIQEITQGMNKKKIMIHVAFSNRIVKFTIEEIEKVN